MTPAEPEKPCPENVLGLTPVEREKRSIYIAEHNDLETIRERLTNLYRIESKLHLAYGILEDTILKHEISNLIATREIEFRAFRIKVGFDMK